MAVAQGVAVHTVQPNHTWEVDGINSKPQLAVLERTWQLVEAQRLLTQGVTLADPARIDVRGTLTCGRDVENLCRLHLRRCGEPGGQCARRRVQHHPQREHRARHADRGLQPHRFQRGRRELPHRPIRASASRAASCMTTRMWATSSRSRTARSAKVARPIISVTSATARWAAASTSAPEPSPAITTARTSTAPS